MENHNDVPRTKFADIYDQNERIRMLKSEAEKVTTENYERKLMPEEIVEMEHNLAEETIMFKEKEQELSDIKKSYQVAMKPINERINTLTESIKTGVVQAQGNLYYFRYDNIGKIGVYDGNGMYVYQRLMTKEESTNPMYIEKKEEQFNIPNIGISPNVNFGKAAFDNDLQNPDEDL